MYELRKMVTLDLLNLMKNPLWVAYATGFPILLVIILSFLGGGGNDAMGSLDYFGITMMLFATLLSSSFSANAFMEERIKLPNMRLVMLPVPSYYIPLSKIVATFIFSVFWYTLDGFLLYGLFKVNFGGGHWPAVWILLVATDLFAVVLGVLFCTIFKTETTANQLTSLIIQSLALLSGCFFPIYVLGDKIAAISQYSPITKVITTIFEVIYDRNFQDYVSTLVIILSFSLIGAVVSLKLFKGEDYL
ncbi:ABC transporter permease [Vagococcus sp. BWB3-3]|uniref:ABC transporter permease n=1 Tax=Vagococcus allomyrinae TaxID=2794353 RepID=A0A940P8Y1_9ENTE|nr:ABC transporter permease [Vagococcus allomyrinae]MBP1040629.1 ABC transporter permease [Vagococcus allomyrinae]